MLAPRAGAVFLGGLRGDICLAAEDVLHLIEEGLDLLAASQRVSMMSVSSSCGAPLFRSETHGIAVQLSQLLCRSLYAGRCGRIGTAIVGRGGPLTEPSTVDVFGAGRYPQGRSKAKEPRLSAAWRPGGGNGPTVRVECRPGCGTSRRPRRGSAEAHLGHCPRCGARNPVRYRAPAPIRRAASPQHRLSQHRSSGRTRQGNDPSRGRQAHRECTVRRSRESQKRASWRALVGRA